MEIVDPLAVSDAAYISSNLTEDDYTEWAAGQTLVRGDYRMVSSVHSIYQCLVDHTASSTARAAFTTAVNNSGGYSAGATSIVVDDAGAADTGINAGDTITLGGTVTAVVQSVNRTTETLTLTSGLSAAVVDNAAVARALVPSNSPLAEAAAVADPLVADPDPAHWVYISQTNKWRLFDGRPSQKTANALEIDAGIVLAGRICAVGIVGLEDCSAATIELVHNGDTAVLAWTAPADGGSAITGYQYRSRTGGSAGTWSDWTDMTGATASTTEWTVEGLNPDLGYEFQVRAVNDDGNGGDSNTAELVVTSQMVGDS